VAVVSVPDGQGAFYGCYVKSTGVLRVIDPASTTTARNRCKATETAITWNQKGPQGLPGPAGPQGPPGPGLTGFVALQGFVQMPTLTAGLYEGRLTCPGSKVALNPGFTSQFGSYTLVYSLPVGWNGWKFGFRSSSGFPASRSSSPVSRARRRRQVRPFGSTGTDGDDRRTTVDRRRPASAVNRCQVPVRPAPASGSGREFAVRSGRIAYVSRAFLHGRSAVPPFRRPR
jgi:hypothetical protein